MNFDALGLPKENGATDLQDSARLAGIMTVFGWPQEIDVRQYVKQAETTVQYYVRHPLEIIYNFSRDQAICLMAGLFAAGYSYLVNENSITGKDLLSPSVMGHVARCKGQKASWFQDLWLWLDVWFHANVTPLEEPNQLLCMMMTADKKFLRYWTTANPAWVTSIKNYWCGWRNEPELAQFMIDRIMIEIQY